MTITETRPTYDEFDEPQAQAQVSTPMERVRPSRAGWWAGAAAGFGVIAVAIALVALSVSLGDTESSRSSVPLAAAAAPAGQAAGPGAAPSPGPQAFTAAAPAATLQEFKVGVATDIPAGKYTFAINNGGTVQHELLVFHPDASIDAGALPLGPDGNVNEDAAGINKISDGDNIDPGQSQTREIDLTQPGTYVFVCNLPGHYRLGMWTKVTVH